MAELADALVSKAGELTTRVGSSPTLPTNLMKWYVFHDDRYVGWVIADTETNALLAAEGKFMADIEVSRVEVKTRRK